MADFTDDFNRADSTTLGSSWIEKERVGFPEILQVHLNALGVVSSRNYGYAYFDGSPTATDQYSELTVGSPGTGSQPEFYVGVRFDTSLGESIVTCYAARGHPAGAFLYRFVNVDMEFYGTPVLLAENTGVSFAQGDIVRLEVLGSTLTVRRNGVVVIQTTDTMIASGRPGILKDRDDFGNASVWHWDDWKGGDTYTISQTVEVVVCPVSIVPTSFSFGGGIRETPTGLIVVTAHLEDWHRSKVRLQSLWSGSSEALLGNVQADASWRFGSAPDERDSFPTEPDSPDVLSGVKLL